jgi:magnesium transporter
MLLLTQEIIDKIDPADASNAYTRDVRDMHVKQKNLYDVLSENSNHLLNIYFNISSQRTNKTMRVLTIFSVFFMPLTFIAGIYGMNFQYMPELRWKYGYPAMLALMAVVVVAIYIWFRKKRWL